MKLWVQSTKPGGEDKRFEVVAYDPVTKKGKVKSKMGTVFDEDLSKEFLVKHGYKIVKEE